jgi:serine protease DegQ
MIAFEVRVSESTAERPASPIPATPSELEGAEFADLDRGDPRYGSLRGVRVISVRPGSVAWRAGLVAGDVIVAVNRQPVGSVDELTAALTEARVPFAVEVEREGGRMFLVVQ